MRIGRPYLPSYPLRIRRGVVAVSYTHLDVYKRQGAIRSQENGQAYQFSADGRNAEYHCQIPATRTDG